MRNDQPVTEASIDFGCGCTKCRALALLQTARVIAPESHEEARLLLLMAAALDTEGTAGWLAATAQAFSISRRILRDAPPPRRMH
ncbi:hypothetical protein [Salipiger sp. PrR002]|uniref:hypothetical protein n=1 Tax=Salipiger sp. PrR002 TaxID=2706489 RepID=UPI0013BA824B|nr:hypothetical protein [Salipiger sp. PrR002]NDW00059.1 hypothetical protein [Salipiger sp. PrR002]NDW56932.1 hypothetical protein [Salipiger sp. PrR004]